MSGMPGMNFRWAHNHRRACLVLVGLMVVALVCHGEEDMGDEDSSPTSSSRAMVVEQYLVRAIHVFFYLWYGNPGVEGLWRHWDHFVLPHWTTPVNDRFVVLISTTRRYHFMTRSMAVTRGRCYGAFHGCVRDPEVIKSQLRELRDAGVTVVVLSWWGRPTLGSSADSQGVETDGAIPFVLQAAVELEQEGSSSLGNRPPLKVAFHLEPYPGRTALSVRDDIDYIVSNYGQSPAFIPLYYVYDSYHIDPPDWAQVLTPGGPQTVRGTELDGVFLGLWLDGAHGSSFVEAGFDGFYPYFASSGFSYGSTPHHWPDMVSFGKSHGLLPVLSVGPGYNDEKIRPWNKENTKPRREGAYYDRMFEAAVSAEPSAISITSYNEWGEGTQIEPATPKRCTATTAGNDTHLPTTPYSYLDYSPRDPFFYLQRTRHWAHIFHQGIQDVLELGDPQDADPGWSQEEL